MGNLPFRAVDNRWLIAAIVLTIVTLGFFVFIAPFSWQIVTVGTLIVGIAIGLWVAVFFPIRFGVYAAIVSIFLLYLLWQRIFEPLLIVIFIVLIVLAEGLFQLVRHMVNRARVLQ